MHKTNYLHAKWQKKRDLALHCLVASVGLWFLSGCSSAHYRRSADNEAYGIVRQVEKQLFGHTNSFTVDTSYSGRKPDTVLPAELINDRLQTNSRVLSVEETLGLAIQNSRQYQTEKERLYLTALTLTGQRFMFTPQFFASSSGKYSRTSQGEEYGSVNNRAGVSYLLRTGGTLSANLVNDLLRYYTGDPWFPASQSIWRNRCCADLAATTPPSRASGRPSATSFMPCAKQMQILNAIDRFEDYQRKVRVAANGLKTGLNFSADASYDASSITDYTQFDPNKIRAGVGLQLDLPLNRQDERNTYRATLVSFESELRNLTLTLDNLRDSSALVDYQVTRLQLMLDIGALETERPKFWLQDHLQAFLTGTAPGIQLLRGQTR